MSGAHGSDDATSIAERRDNRRFNRDRLNADRPPSLMAPDPTPRACALPEQPEARQRQEHGRDREALIDPVVQPIRLRPRDCATGWSGRGGAWGGVHCLACLSNASKWAYATFTLSVPSDAAFPSPCCRFSRSLCVAFLKQISCPIGRARFAQDSEKKHRLPGKSLPAACRLRLKIPRGCSRSLRRHGCVTAGVEFR